MSDLLVLVASSGDAVADSYADVADAAPVWPWLAGGATEWAARLHDEFARRQTPPVPDDVARIASWLRVQAVGRDTVIVTERRIADFAGVWAAGAARADVPAVRLTRSVGSPGEPVVAAVVGPASDIDAPLTSTGRDRSKRNQVLDRARLWAVDRAEDAARLAVRALQR